jgi:hypothetical protein
MKKVLFYLFLTVTSVTFSQTTNSNEKVDTMMYDNSLQNIVEFTKDYAELMSTWTPEKREEFKIMFVQKRGDIKIIDYPYVKPRD